MFEYGWGETQLSGVSVSHRVWRLGQNEKKKPLENETDGSDNLSWTFGTLVVMEMSGLDGANDSSSPCVTW